MDFSRNRKACDSKANSVVCWQFNVLGMMRLLTLRREKYRLGLIPLGEQSRAPFYSFASSSSLLITFLPMPFSFLHYHHGLY